MKIFVLIFSLFTFFSINIKAQVEAHFYSHTQFGKVEKKLVNKKINTTFKPLIFNDIDSLNFLYNENNNELIDNKFLNFFYAKENFGFVVSPLLNLSYSIDKEDSYSNNSRGLLLKGFVGNKIKFQSFFLENQSFFPNYLDSIVRFTRLPGVEIVPGQGEARPFKNRGFDYSRSEGYINYKINNNLTIQFGHGKHFIGNGYRSLILSDNTFSYPFLRLQTNLGIFRYTNLYTEFMDIRNNQLSIIDGYQGWSRKYMSLHFLECEINDRIKIGVFESIIYAENHAPGVSSLDINYLNPIIFYRPVEYSLGSPDNALIGIDLKINTSKKQFLYAQLILDEFTLEEIKSNNGYWANKYGYQIGYKFLDFLDVIGLNTKLEYNLVRPYTYSHWNSSSYGHYAQPLAHPLGANFDEFIVKLDYYYQRFSVNFKYNFARVGLDDSENLNISYGNDIFLDYNLRSSDYEIDMFNGIKTDITNLALDFAYLVDETNSLKVGVFVRSRTLVNENSDSNESYFGIYLKTDLFNYYYDR